MTVYLSRLTLRRDPSTEALKDLIDPKHRARATDAHHRLMWSVFSDCADRKRDFLWRAEPRGRFYTLSNRPPEPHGLFEAPEVKEFAPALSPGDRLAFVLRANAVTQRAKDPNDRSPPSPKHPQGRVKSRKVDVAMDLLKDFPARVPSNLPGSAAEPGDRQTKRHCLARRAAYEWLLRQGDAHGFKLNPLAVKPEEGDQPDAGFVLEHYQTVTLPDHRGRRKDEPRFGVFDMKGVLTVTDPTSFLDKLAFKLDAPGQDPLRSGFGRAKGYGCGLMLIRRA